MSNRLLSAHAAPRTTSSDGFLHDVLNGASARDTARILGKLAQPMRITRGSGAPLEPGRDALAYIGTGATKRIACASGGREQIVAFHFSGDLVSIPSEAWHSYGLCALSDTDILAFPADEFLNVAREEPALLNALLERSLIAALAMSVSSLFVVANSLRLFRTAK